MVVGQDIELDRNLKFGVSGEDTMKTVGFLGVFLVLVRKNSSGLDVEQRKVREVGRCGWMWTVEVERDGVNWAFSPSHLTTAYIPYRNLVIAG